MTADRPAWTLGPASFSVMPVPRSYCLVTCTQLDSSDTWRRPGMITHDKAPTGQRKGLTSHACTHAQCQVSHSSFSTYATGFLPCLRPLQDLLHKQKVPVPHGWRAFGFRNLVLTFSSLTSSRYTVHMNHVMAHETLSVEAGILSVL